VVLCSDEKDNDIVYTKKEKGKVQVARAIDRSKFFILCTSVCDVNLIREVKVISP